LGAQGTLYGIYGGRDPHRKRGRGRGNIILPGTPLVKRQFCFTLKSRDVTCEHAVSYMDCGGGGGAGVQVGRSAGFLFYGQSHQPTSAIPTSTTPPSTTDDTTIVTASSSLDYADPGQSTKKVRGGETCRWTLVALPGQRVRLRVVVVDPWDDLVLGSESHNVVGGTDTCPQTILIEDSVLMSTVHLPVCRGRQRDSQIYLSIGHHLSIRVEDSGVLVMRPSKTGNLLHHSPPPTSSANARRSGFLLTYECK